MKSTFALILAATFATLFLARCNKEEKEFNTNFYTSTEGAQMSLYIDGEYKGVLPYMATIPECGASYGDGTPPLTFRLKVGQYRITGKNPQGVVVSDAVVTIRKNGIGGSGKMGGNRVDSQGEDCLAIGLFE